MTLRIPTEIPPQLVAIAAGPFPDADEDQLRYRRDCLRNAAGQCRALADRHDAANAQILAMSGATATAVATAGTTNSINLRTVAAVLNNFADQCDHTADSVEFAKKVIIVTLIMLSAQLTWDTFMFVYGGAIKSFTDETLARLAIREAGEEATRIVAEHAAVGAAERAGLPAIVKILAGGAIWGGLPTVIAHEWDVHDHVDDGMTPLDVAVAAASGAAGGMAGAGVGARVANRLGSSVTNSAGRFGRYLAHVGIGLAAAAGGGAAGGIVGAAAGQFLNNIIDAAHGQPLNLLAGFNPHGLLNDAASGIGGECSAARAMPSRAVAISPANLSLPVQNSIGHRGSSSSSHPSLRNGPRYS